MWESTYDALELVEYGMVQPEEPVQSVPPVQLFVCGQQTAMLQSEQKEFIGTATLNGPIKVAYPAFNRPKKPGVTMDQRCVTFDAPVYGIDQMKAVVSLFTGDEMLALANSLDMRMPQYSLSIVVRDKGTPKVMKLIEYAKKRDDCQSGKNAEAIERLEGFIDAFIKLDPNSITSFDDWENFVKAHVLSTAQDNWYKKLSFSDVLPECFGFDPVTASELRKTLHTKTEGENTETKTLEQYSVRWISKCLGAYSVEGAISDVVNLAVAMQNEKMPEAMKAPDTIAILQKMKRDLDNPANLKELWVPTHLMHDSELDDRLTWLLLERVHRLLNSNLQVRVQMPTDSKFDLLSQHYMDKGNSVFRDPDSANGEAVENNCEYLIDKLKKEDWKKKQQHRWKTRHGPDDKRHRLHYAGLK